MRIYIYKLQCYNQDNFIHTGGNIFCGWHSTDEYTSSLENDAADMGDRLRVTFCMDVLQDIKSQISILHDVGERYFRKCMTDWSRWLKWYCTVLFDRTVIIGAPYIYTSEDCLLNYAIVCCAKNIEYIINDFSVCDIQEKIEAEYIADTQANTQKT